jgi:hypothetical protein
MIKRTHFRAGRPRRAVSRAGLKTKGSKHMEATLYRNPAKVKAGISFRPILMSTQDVDHRNVTKSAWSTARRCGKRFSNTLTSPRKEKYVDTQGRINLSPLAYDPSGLGSVPLLRRHLAYGPDPRLINRAVTTLRLMQDYYSLPMCVRQSGPHHVDTWN